MTRKMFVWTIMISLLLLVGMASARDMSRTMPIPAKQALVTGDELLPEAPYYPSSPSVICQSPGDTCGFTQYDYQSNGSSGHRIAVDNLGNIHVAWMKAINNLATRHVYYNCKSTSGWSTPGIGSQVDYNTTGPGYNQITVTNDDRGAVTYHRSTTGQESVYVAIDAFTCLSSFEYKHPPNRLSGRILMWPYITIDRQNRIHVVATHNATPAGAAQVWGYTRSTDGGATWSALATVDTSEVIAEIIVSSRISDKVAMVYMNPVDTASQWMNDVYYVQSADGINWDFRNNKVNVTHYGQGGDSSFAYTDLAALYDYNDNLHIIWNSQYVTDNGIYYSSKMNHYDVTSGMITQFAEFDSTWPSAGCEFGVWNFAYCKMSLSVDLRNDIYATYTSWDTSDCSAGGFANGDIYAQWSTDGGASWSERVNVTNSHTPGCDPGDCDSDHWSSMAEKADTALHIFYVNDKDPGGIPQSEGAITNNPMLYTHYVAPPLLGVNDDVEMPKGFALSQNYPNPFNAKTNIGFELANASKVELSVYDVTGSKVATLYKGNLEAGAHQINWDASQVASGVYYYTLKANGGEVTKKMTLLK